MHCKTSWRQDQGKPCHCCLRQLAESGLSFFSARSPKLQALLHKALLMTSIHFPGAQHDIIQHLMHHIVDGIEANGPPWASAMWAFERLWYVLISQNHSTKHPATSMMMNWRAERLADWLCERIDLLLSPPQVPPHAMHALFDY